MCRNEARFFFIKIDLHFSCLFLYFVMAYYSGMNALEMVDFTKGQKVDIERQMRYIDFVARQGFSLIPGRDDVRAVFDATMLLLNVDYTQAQLYAMMTEVEDNSSQALFVRRYYELLSVLLGSDVDVTFDESRIIEFFQKLFVENEGATSGAARRMPAVSLLRRSVVARDSITVSGELSELVEWFLVGGSGASSLSLVNVAKFLYQFVRKSTLPRGREEVMHLLMLLLLQRMGYNWVQVCAPANVMVEDRVAYRRALLGNSDAREGVAKWVLYFVDAVYESAKRFSAMHAPQLPPKSASHKGVLNIRQRAILDYIGSNHPVGLSSIVGHMHKESVNTIKKDLQHLRTLGIIASDGVQKGTVYYKI